MLAFVYIMFFGYHVNKIKGIEGLKIKIKISGLAGL
jgi:hypothetical protein